MQAPASPSPPHHSRQRLKRQQTRSTHRRSLGLLLLAVAGYCNGSTVLLNPSFEDDDMTQWTRTAISGIRPWGRGAAGPHDGNWYVFTVNEASIEQSFSPILGTNIIELNFWVQRPSLADMFVELVFAGGGPSKRIDIPSDFGNGWRQYDVLPHVDPWDTISAIRITKLGSGVARLDDFHFNVVPEPKSMILTVGGLLANLRRKRPKKSG